VSLDADVPACRYIAATPIIDKPWKLMTFCVQTKDDAADISKRCVLEMVPRLG